MERGCRWNRARSSRTRQVWRSRRAAPAGHSGPVAVGAALGSDGAVESLALSLALAVGAARGAGSDAELPGAGVAGGSGAGRGGCLVCGAVPHARQAPSVPAHSRTVPAPQAPFPTAPSPLQAQPHCPVSTPMGPGHPAPDHQKGR